MALSGGGHLGVSRRLFKALRDLMAANTDTQNRLDSMVTQIAGEMVADVCSIYLRRNDGSMELCATEGLKPEAVHRTRLKPSEGLVGLVADGVEPVSLADAPKHRAFSYRPETGEDPFQSFLGVPMLKGGRLIGVLVVQNRVSISYPDDDVETLQTIATVLAEIVAATENFETLNEFDIKPTGQENLSGRTYSNGIAKGIALMHAPEVAATHFLSGDIDAEIERLEKGLEDLRAGIDSLLKGEEQALGSVSLEVLEMISMLARDVSWERRLIEGVRAGLTAEASVEQVRSEHRARLSNAKDAYLRDRLHDLEELDNRLLRHLSGKTTLPNSIEGDFILIARDIGPAELLEYRSSNLKAVLLEEGSNSSHSAIIARAMGLPMIGGIKNLLARVASNDPVIVDGLAQSIYIRYEPMVEKAFETRFIAQEIENKRAATLKDVECKTLDGKNLALFMNAGLALDMGFLEPSGAVGVGLFRTEFQFMIAKSLPRVDAQAALYTKILDEAGEKPVIFRTLDLGGDKIARFMHSEGEENPAMGWRALRLGLDRQPLLRYQIRALLRAAEGRQLNVMFPLVTTTEEFAKAREMVFTEVEWAKSHGRNGPKYLKIGAMIEAPSIAWSVADIVKTADFLSIGTNDLMQFFFAADRGSAKVNDRYDLLSKEALGFLKHIKENSGEVPVSICGEHAGRTLEAMALIGLGYERLSMPASGLLKVKEMILSLDLEKLRGFTTQLLTTKSGILRSDFLEYANQNNVKL